MVSLMKKKNDQMFSRIKGLREVNIILIFEKFGEDSRE